MFDLILGIVYKAIAGGGIPFKRNELFGAAEEPFTFRRGCWVGWGC